MITSRLPMIHLRIPGGYILKETINNQGIIIQL